ncbi:hypothetical protein Ngar_c08630 [Candidatus Nitrososphaera gargensis Ga9.2]|uniref:Uncharacterized protein n=1 Tax=Nitrososphaera gargensis (strain Ga9.2) TaxID=1237085 RepID=K0IDN3_NITGG|nr:hypothetical protein Ngar_c08630 [Candidatus Nitrososphaera gargensis Ga9.2]
MDRAFNLFYLWLALLAPRIAKIDNRWQSATISNVRIAYSLCAPVVLWFDD